MSNTYNGLEFGTSLLARWAAFFHLAGWSWQANPAPVNDWTPDFRVSFPCGHSECPEQHVILVSVLAIDGMDRIAGHPALKHAYTVSDAEGTTFGDACAVFGTTPSASRWAMAHGAGGGDDSVLNSVPNAAELWRRAGDLVSSS